MRSTEFIGAIEKLIKNYYSAAGSFKVPVNNQEFILNIKELFSEVCTEIIKMNKLTVIFEGFYQSISEASSLKNDLKNLRMKRWRNHYGTPTVPFLLIYQNKIEEIRKYFSNFEKNTVSNSSCLRNNFLLDAGPSKSVIHDTTNSVIVSTEVMNDIPTPQVEITGQFVKTYNPFGGFTTAPCDPFSQAFIKYAGEVAGRRGKVLEIGAGFGAATLAALAKNTIVYCNDRDPKNLAVVKNRFQVNDKISQDHATGDSDRLVLVPGAFPEELAGLPKHTFDGILVCRVLHFFPGKKIQTSLQLMHALLKPGGRIFVVCETPFLKNWQRFIPEHERRIEAGVEWPGEIENPAEFESSGFASSLPKFVHWVTKEIIERSLKSANFEIIKSSYINRRDQFPESLLLDGQESVGVIGAKQA